MKTKRCVLFVLVVLMIAVSSVSFALPIATDRVRIWQKGDEVFFALQVDDLPEEFEINKKSTQDMALEYSYRIQFFDGERLYECGAVNFKFSSSVAQSVPVSSFQQSLWQTDIGGRGASVLTGVKCQRKGDEIIWTVGLPVIDREGNEIEITFDAITHLGFNIIADDLGKSERQSYEIVGGLALIDLGDTHLARIIYP